MPVVKEIHLDEHQRQLFAEEHEQMSQAALRRLEEKKNHALHVLREKILNEDPDVTEAAKGRPLYDKLVSDVGDVLSCLLDNANNPANDLRIDEGLREIYRVINRQYREGYSLASKEKRQEIKENIVGAYFEQMGRYAESLLSLTIEGEFQREVAELNRQNQQLQEARSIRLALGYDPFEENGAGARYEDQLKVIQNAEGILVRGPKITEAMVAGALGAEDLHFHQGSTFFAGTMPLMIQQLDKRPKVFSERTNEGRYTDYYYEKEAAENFLNIAANLRPGQNISFLGCSVSFINDGSFDARNANHYEYFRLTRKEDGSYILFNSNPCQGDSREGTNFDGEYGLVERGQEAKYVRQGNQSTEDNGLYSINYVIKRLKERGIRVESVTRQCLYRQADSHDCGVCAVQACIDDLSTASGAAQETEGSTVLLEGEALARVRLEHYSALLSCPNPALQEDLQSGTCNKLVCVAVGEGFEEVLLPATTGLVEDCLQRNFGNEQRLQPRTEMPTPTVLEQKLEVPGSVSAEISESERKKRRLENQLRFINKQLATFEKAMQQQSDGLFELRKGIYKNYLEEKSRIEEQLRTGQSTSQVTPVSSQCKETLVVSNEEKTAEKRNLSIPQPVVSGRDGSNLRAQRSLAGVTLLAKAELSSNETNLTLSLEAFREILNQYQAERNHGWNWFFGAKYGSHTMKNLANLLLRKTTANAAEVSLEEIRQAITEQDRNHVQSWTEVSANSRGTSKVLARIEIQLQENLKSSIPTSELRC